MNFAERELLVRSQTWGVYLYRPSAAPKWNDQLGFHQSKAQVRVILGANRSGKTEAMMAELAALALGEPYPWWFNWDGHPKAPLTIWLVLPQFPANPSEDARIKKLYRGERKLTREGRWRWSPPYIPPGMIQWHSPDWHEVMLTNGTTISIKSTNQDDLAMSSNNVDFIVVDEPTESNKWRELVSRMIATPISRMIHGLTDASLTTDYLDELLDNPEVGQWNFTTAGNPHTDRAHAEKTFRLQTREQQLVTRLGMRTSDVLKCYPKMFRWIDESTGREIRNFQGGEGNWIRPIALPPEWTRYVIHDPGIKNCCTCWFAVEPETQNIFCYRCCFIRQAGSNVRRICEILDRANKGEEIETWFMDPKAGKQTPRNYVWASMQSIIDVYRKSSESLGIQWRLGPPNLENYRRVSRIKALTGYLDPLDSSMPMMYFFDVADGLDPEKNLYGMDALKYEFKRYRWNEARDRPVRENDNGPYCCEAAAVIPLRWKGGSGQGNYGWHRIGPRHDPVAEFLNGDKPSHWKEEP